MIIRALSSSGDATFGQGVQNFLNNQNAVALNIKTNLYCFLRDCYFDIQKGIDWLRFFSVPTNSQEVLLSVRANILLSFGVVSINSIDVSVSGRKIIINASVNTIYTSNFKLNLEYVPVS
jgi:hypothetical protein